MGFAHGVPHFYQSVGISNDTFSRVDSNQLNSAEVGGLWSQVTGTFGIRSGKAFNNMNFPGEDIATLPVTVSTGQIQCDVYLSPGHSNVGLVARYLSTGYIFTQLILTSAQNSIQFGKKVNSINTFWAQSNPAGLVAGNGYTLTLVISSTTASFYVDDVLIGIQTFTAQDLLDLTGTAPGIRSTFGTTVDDDNGSSFDNWATTPAITLTPRAPAPFLNAPVAASTGASTAQITWVKAGNGGSAITSYTVQSSHGEVFTGISPNATSFNAISLAPVAQTFTVTAINAFGSTPSATSNSVTLSGTTVPTAPQSAAAGSGSNASATISWTLPLSNGGSAILSYTATEVSPNPGAHSQTINGATATQLTVTALTNGTPYTFSVVATNSIGNSPSSNVTNSVIPGVGTPIEIDSGGPVTGAWTADTAVSPSPYLTIGAPAEIATVSNTIDLTDPSVPASTPQSIMQSERFSATNLIGYDFTVPSGQTTVNLYFSENYGPAQHVGGRLMNITINGTLVESNYDTWALVGSYKAQVRTYVVTTTGTLSIRIANTGATGSNSPHCMGVFIVPPFSSPTVPSSPTGVSAVAGNALATVTWSAAADGGSALIDYTIASTPVRPTVTVPAGTTVATYPGLTNGTAYTFKVTARNSIGSSAPSVASTPVTPSSGSNPPPTFPPSSFYLVGPGQSFATIGSAIAAAPTGAAIGVFNATYNESNLIPKNSQYILGQSQTGVIVDGQSTASNAFTGTASGVTLDTFTVQNYRTAHLVAAISGLNASNWQLKNLHVTNNNEEGISVGPGFDVGFCHIEFNGNCGIGTGTANNDPTGQPFANLIFLIHDNEINNNGALNGTDAAGSKVLFTNGAQFVNNNVHHNQGFGIWWDAWCVNSDAHGNNVHDNQQGGIFHEISKNGTIHDNTVLNNHTATGTDYTKQSCGIGVSSSSNVFVFNNTLQGNGDGIGLFNGHLDQDPQPLNVLVHDNIFLDAKGSSGYQYANDTGFQTSSCHFYANTYQSGQQFRWGSLTLINLAQFIALGQETGYVPDKPTGVTGTAGNGQVVVNWTAPATVGASPIIDYTVTSSPGSFTATVGASLRTATVTGLTNGTAYTFTIRARNTGGSGLASAPSAPVTPTITTGTIVDGRDIKNNPSLVGCRIATGSLVTVNGSLSPADGSTVSGRMITGDLNLDGSTNVTVRDCVIKGSVSNSPEATNSLVQYCTIGTFTDFGVHPTCPDQMLSYGGTTLQYCDIFGGSDIIRANGTTAHPTVLDACYLHANCNKQATGDHSDIIQMTQGQETHITRCWLETSPNTGSDAAILAGADQGNISGVYIDRNLFTQLSPKGWQFILLGDGNAGTGTNMHFTNNWVESPSSTWRTVYAQLGSPLVEDTGNHWYPSGDPMNLTGPNSTHG